EHGAVDGVLNRLDDFASETGQLVPRGGVVALGGKNGDLLNGHSDTLNRLVAERALGHGQLEGVCDLVGKVVGAERLVALGRSLVVTNLVFGEELGKDAVRRAVD